VEVYGGPILATFADRDLSLAGRVMLRGAAGPQARLLRFERPLLRLPNLAIHMNREVNEAGLKFDKQTELPLLLGLLGKDGDADARLRELLAAAVQCAPDDLLSWELAAYDVQPGSLWGADEEFIASRQLDNLASCHAALSALTAVERAGGDDRRGPVRPRGSRQRKRGGRRRQLRRRRAGAHRPRRRAGRRRPAPRAGQQLLHQRRHGPCLPPEFPGGLRARAQGDGEWRSGDQDQRQPALRHRRGHRGAFHGPAAKHAGVPCQQYSHRGNLGCGSTIGPIVAARLGIAGVDVGSPMWAMHSARESAGALDPAWMIAALAACYLS
jgi:aspartyl aminopeptidase